MFDDNRCCRSRPTVEDYTEFQKRMQMEQALIKVEARHAQLLRAVEVQARTIEQMTNYITTSIQEANK